MVNDRLIEGNFFCDYSNKKPRWKLDNIADVTAAIILRGTWVWVWTAQPFDYGIVCHSIFGSRAPTATGINLEEPGDDLLNQRELQLRSCKKKRTEEMKY